MISQVCAPAPRFSDRAGRRSGPEKLDGHRARYLCFVSVRALAKHLNRSSRYSSYASGVARGRFFPPSFFRTRGLSMTRWFAGVDDLDRRSRSYLQRRLRESGGLRRGHRARQAYVAQAPHGKKGLSRPMGKRGARYFRRF